MATRNIVPRANGEGSIGTAAKHWGSGWMDELNTDLIAPPSGSTNNSVGAPDRPWREGHFDAVKIGGGDLGEYLAESTGYGIVSGCEPSISGLTVTVASGVVHLADGTRKEIASTNITLDAADTTNPRIDLVYITSAGVVAKITGTAAASPSAPALPTAGISVAQVSVAAGASTGTLTDKRKMLNPCFYYDSVSSMVSDKTLKVGAVACTLGYYSANDGGGAVYVVREESASVTVNNMDIISLDNGCVGQLIYDRREINIAQLGAKGDGVQNEHAIFVRAIALANSLNTGWTDYPQTWGNGGGVVKIGVGKHKFSGTPLDVSGMSGLTIRGSGKLSTVIYCDEGFINATTTPSTGLSVEDLTIALSGEIVGIHLTPAYDIHIDRCCFRNAANSNFLATGIKLHETVGVYVNDTDFFCLDVGVELYSDTNILDTTIYFTKCWFANLNYGFKTNYTTQANVTNVAFTDTIIEGINQIGIYVVSGGDSMSGLTLCKCHIEQTIKALHVNNAYLSLDESNVIAGRNGDYFNSMFFTITASVSLAKNNNATYMIRGNNYDDIVLTKILAVPNTHMEWLNGDVSYVLDTNKRELMIINTNVIDLSNLIPATIADKFNVEFARYDSHSSIIVGNINGTYSILGTIYGTAPTLTGSELSVALPYNMGTWTIHY